MSDCWIGRLLGLQTFTKKSRVRVGLQSVGRSTSPFLLSAHHLIGAYFLTTKADKCMRLLTRLYGIALLGLGNMGNYSALWFCIVPTFTRANTATLYFLIFPFQSCNDIIEYASTLYVGMAWKFHTYMAMFTEYLLSKIGITLTQSFLELQINMGRNLDLLLLLLLFFRSIFVQGSALTLPLLHFY